MPLKPLQYMGNFGNQLSASEAESDPLVSEYGNPQIHGAFSGNSIQDGESFRGVNPRWAPGEFEEWKQAHLTGMPTTYGWNAQQAYKSRKSPGLQDMINNGARNANRVMAGMVGPQNNPDFNPILMGLIRGLK